MDRIIRLLVKTEGWYEVQDYVYDTNHIISSLELFAGRSSGTA